MPTLVSIFDRPDDVVNAVKKLKGRGFTDLETYCPAPFPEIDDAVHEKPSVVRLFTLIGGLTGVVAGFAGQSGGTLELASEPRGGTAVTLTLPCRPPAP